MVTKYGQDGNVTQLVNGYNWHVLAVANPDGYVYSWTQVSPIMTSYTQTYTHAYTQHYTTLADLIGHVYLDTYMDANVYTRVHTLYIREVSLRQRQRVRE